MGLVNVKLSQNGPFMKAWAAFIGDDFAALLQDDPKAVAWSAFLAGWTAAGGKLEDKIEKKLVCPYCQHLCCDNCETAKWNIAEVNGIKCCQCTHRHSTECWRSGNHRGVVTECTRCGNILPHRLVGCYYYNDAENTSLKSS